MVHPQQFPCCKHDLIARLVNHLRWQRKTLVGPFASFSSWDSPEYWLGRHDAQSGMLHQSVWKLWRRNRIKSAWRKSDEYVDRYWTIRKRAGSPKAPERMQRVRIAYGKVVYHSGAVRTCLQIA